MYLGCVCPVSVIECTGVAVCIAPNNLCVSSEKEKSIAGNCRLLTLVLHVCSRQYLCGMSLPT
uniref:Uncharacterized protein n=1 Tax=Anguilla anguilla TaxID=7936 RepID=A0A0E9XRN8_ANGAN